MKKLASAAVATVLAGLMIAPVPASAASGDFGKQQRYVSQQCMAHPNWKGCGDWKHNRHKWGHNDYRNWYRWNQPNIGTVAAGIFGFALGAAIVGSNRTYNDGYSSWDDHVEACEDRYRSYDERTDTFLGYDGLRHRCRL